MESGVIIVAVDASKEISDHALEWAVRNVIKPSDTLFLLAILPSQKHATHKDRNHRQSRASQLFSSLLKKWVLRLVEKSPSSDVKRLTHGAEQDRIKGVESVCELMVQQTFLSYNLQKVHGEVRVVADAPNGSVASVAGERGATWVILDRHLKKEGDCCLKQLICNIVIIDHATPRILRSVNPTSNAVVERSDHIAADMLDLVPVFSHRSSETGSTISRSSLGLESPDNKSSLSTKNFKPNGSYIHLNSQYFPEGSTKQGSYSPSPLKSEPRSLNKGSSFNINQQPRRAPAGHWDGKRKSYSGPLKTGIGKKQIQMHNMNLMEDLKSLLFKREADTKKGNHLAALYALPAPPRRSVDSSSSSRPMTLRSNPSNEIIPRKHSLVSLNNNGAAKEESPLAIGRSSSIRRAMDLTIKHPLTPPPLCSICKHKAPHFGKAPRKISYEEIKTATNGFAVQNFLAEGGFGSVYRGILPDGQVIAVKQPKFLSAQGASEFCSEVEVLSYAQHKNLVMLVGYCIEIEWLLVYEYVCNGSLDKHLYGQGVEEVMAWHHRMKVARGAARGLRYLHEDCRVGCIIHRDFRPNNILLTHDFEPMVGDFGLARWQADGQLADETRVVGAFGYLAPEYTQSGFITGKADVYAYGVVLLELLSGYKATEFLRNTGKQFVSDWGLPLLQARNVEELIDPRLVNDYVHEEVKCMVHAAKLCLLPVPEQRPRMSQVLKILDGDMPSNMLRGHAHCANENMNGSITLHLTQLMSSPIKSPAQISESGKTSKEIARNSTVSSDGCQEERDGCYASEQSESLVSQEYQAYLQGSLAKFIQNMNVK